MLLLNTNADVAELADALDLGSSSERSEGSSPFIRIYQLNILKIDQLNILKYKIYFSLIEILKHGSSVLSLSRCSIEEVRFSHTNFCCYQS